MLGWEWERVRMRADEGMLSEDEASERVVERARKESLRDAKGKGKAGGRA